MPHESPPPAFIDPDTTWLHAERSNAGGAGWFDSSWELRRGLEVRESWTHDGRFDGWIEDFLPSQRATGRIASPSASTAIA